MLHRAPPGLRPTLGAAGTVCVVALALAVAHVLARGAPHPPFSPRVPHAAALDGFDFRRSAAAQVRLPHVLREVSDLAVTSDGRMFAVGDEQAVVFELDVQRGAIVKEFALGAPAVRADFEGIAVAEGRVFLLTSAGILYEAREGADRTAVPYATYDTGVGARCELEGLAYDPADHALLLACKASHAAVRRDVITVARWSIPGRGLLPAGRPAPSVASATRGTDARDFNPSAIAREPRSGHWVLVAGRQRLLAELAPDGAVIAVRTLDRRLHPQPEGIAFLGDTAVLISDEGGGGRATLTRYSRVR